MKLLLDAGHGGMAFGDYYTAGKRSPVVGPGVGIYEGEFNRHVAAEAALMIGSDCLLMNPGPINIPLKDRVAFANKVQRNNKDSFLISIHANAMGKGKWNKANGYVVFRKKKNDALTVALSEIAIDQMHNFLRYKHWMKSRGIKEANYSILFGFQGPAILIEFGFMTNRNDAKLLTDNTYRSDCARVIAATYWMFCDYMGLVNGK